MTGRRADTLLAERGLAPSRTAAAASIRAGRVRLGRDGPTVEKPSELIPEDGELIVAEALEFASRGGLKLANALDELGLPVSGRRCLDAGASTGGFTDCLLQRGAAEVIAVDVGHGQLDWRLRNDPRVHVLERTNARELTADLLPFAPELVTVDVSFISALKLVGPLRSVAAPAADFLIMVKPQFELGRGRVRGGVVRDPAERREAVTAVASGLAGSGLGVRGIAPSGLPGPKGNRETFIWACERGDAVEDLDAEIARVEP